MDRIIGAGGGLPQEVLRLFNQGSSAKILRPMEGIFSSSKMTEIMVTTAREIMVITIMVHHREKVFHQSHFLRVQSILGSG